MYVCMYECMYVCTMHESKVCKSHVCQLCQQLEFQVVLLSMTVCHGQHLVCIIWIRTPVTTGVVTDSNSNSFTISTSSRFVERLESVYVGIACD